MNKSRKAESDPLLTACEAVLRELADYPVTSERLCAAAPLIREIRAAIRKLDELDISAVEPVTIFRPSRC